MLTHKMKIRLKLFLFHVRNIKIQKFGWIIFGNILNVGQHMSVTNMDGYFLKLINNIRNNHTTVFTLPLYGIQSINILVRNALTNDIQSNIFDNWLAERSHFLSNKLVYINYFFLVTIPTIKQDNMSI